MRQWSSERHTKSRSICRIVNRLYCSATITILTHFSLIDPNRPFPKEPFMNLYSPGNVFPFGEFIDVLIVEPTVTMTGHFPPSIGHGLAGLFVPFEGHADRKDSTG